MSDFVNNCHKSGFYQKQRTAGFGNPTMTQETRNEIKPNSYPTYQMVHDCQLMRVHEQSRGGIIDIIRTFNHPSNPWMHAAPHNWEFCGPLVLITSTRAASADRRSKSHSDQYFCLWAWGKFGLQPRCPQRDEPAVHCRRDMEETDK